MKFIINYLIVVGALFFFQSCDKTDINPDPATPSTEYQLNLQGVVKSCIGNGLNNGVLVMESKRHVMTLEITDGSFDTTIKSVHPFDTIYVWAIDYDSLKTSDTLEVVVLGDSVQLGNILACYQEVDEYLSLQIDNDNFRFVPILWDTLMVASFDTLAAPTTYIYRGDLFYTGGFHRFQFAGMAVGTYQANWNSSLMIGRYYSFNMPDSGVVNYTSYGNVGEYIRGTMHVPFIDNTDSLRHLLSGRFKVRRDH